MLGKVDGAQEVKVEQTSGLPVLTVEIDRHLRDSSCGILAIRVLGTGTLPLAAPQGGIDVEPRPAVIRPDRISEGREGNGT